MEGGWGWGEEELSHERELVLVYQLNIDGRSDLLPCYPAPDRALTCTGVTGGRLAQVAFPSQAGSVTILVADFKGAKI